MESKTLKILAKTAFPSYRGRKFRNGGSRLTFHDLCWGGGTRNYYTAVRLSDRSVMDLAFGAPWSPAFVATEGKTIDVPRGVAIVEHSFFCGHDSGLTVYLPELPTLGTEV